jgi:putative ABC transport system permease protein
MGINTREFGITANFDSTLMRTHWYHYLNAMAQDPYGVIVSSNFRDEKGYKLGDTITYRDASKTTTNTIHGYGYTMPLGKNTSAKTVNGVIYGFVDYWPGFASTKTELTAAGDVVQTNHYLIVASLAQLQMEYGVKPYQIWFDMEGSTQPMYDFLQSKKVILSGYRDYAADVIAMKNEPLFQGTNGILTANFIVVLLLCMVGFLIFWILSIRSRELQFGIFRAMGLSMGEVIRMLLVEQVLISGTSIAIGVGVGILVTRLYLPLIQIAYSAADQVLPLRLVTETGDYVKLFTVIGIMVICCMGILAWLISKIRIAQALKLGED